MKSLKSFRTRILLLLFLFTITTISVFSVIITERMSRLAKLEAYKDITVNCATLKSQIDLHLSGIENCIYQLAVSDAVRTMDAGQLDRMSQDLIRKLPVITQIYIMDKSGMQIYKSSFPETVGDRSDRDYFKGAIIGRSVFSDVIVSRSTQVPIVVQAQPIIRNGEVDGVIGASIDLRFLSTIASQIRSESEGYGFIVDSAGRAIGHPNQKYVADMLDLSYLDPVAAVISGKIGNGTYTFEGIDKLVAYTPLERANWGVLVQVPVKEAFQSIGIIQKLLVMTAFGLVLASFIATYLISRHLEKPIRNIVHMIRIIEKDVYYPPYCSLRADEFGVIENALVSMADTLSKDYDELEGRVEARTIELKTTMNELMETQDELVQSNENLEEAFEKLKSAQKKIVQAEKMAALNRMTVGLAHGINTPLGTALTAISYAAQTLAELKNTQSAGTLTASYLNEQLTEGSNGIQLTHRQLVKAIELITVVNKPSFGEILDEDRQKVDLCSYLNSRLVELKAHLFDTSHSLRVECEIGQCNILYPDVLLQVLNILVGNSVEHGFKDQKNGEIRISVTQNKEVVQVFFQNNGKKIKDSELGCIFEPFYKENMSDHGEGFGLTIAYTLVEKFLGGRITCRNLDPQGVEFMIEIPHESLRIDQEQQRCKPV